MTHLEVDNQDVTPWLQGAPALGRQLRGLGAQCRAGGRVAHHSDLLTGRKPTDGTHGLIFKGRTACSGVPPVTVQL